TLQLHSFPTRRSSDLCRSRYTCVAEPGVPAYVPACTDRSSPSCCSPLSPFRPPCRRRLTPRPDLTPSPNSSRGSTWSATRRPSRSEEHTSELQSLAYL